MGEMTDVRKHLLTIGAQAEPSTRNRAEDAARQGLRPGSLVGSFFHGFGEPHNATQGIITAEPSPGVYLVEFLSWLIPDSLYQKIVPLSAMAEWRFYDDSKWMDNAYQNEVHALWDRARAEAAE